MSSTEVDKTPTGISGLDEILDGGFPRGSLIVLVGSPGTGKTIFSACFLYNGALNYGEKGVYVSFAEGRQVFFRNMCGLKLDFEELERRGDFLFMDMLTVREEAVSTILEAILREVSEIGAKRLVIDSFSAMAQALKDPNEVRVILHTILSKVSRFLGCTTLLIVEVPYGENRFGLGIEEFVADGIIQFRRDKYEGGRFLRALEILKMRGAPIQEANVIFTLKDGFKAFTPFRPKTIRKPSRFQPQPTIETFFSTGSPSLDEILEGGYPRGATVLIETDEHVSLEQYSLLITPTMWNFLVQGRGVIIIPSPGVNPGTILREIEEGGLTRDEISNLLRICIKEYPGISSEPYLIALGGEDASKDYTKYLQAEVELMAKTGQPVLNVIGVNSLVDIYGLKEALSTIGINVARTREMKGLNILLLRPGYSELARILGVIADIHLKVVREYGAVLVYGIKPRTPLYALEIDSSRGYCLPKLTQIV
ncbi:MAG: AAA family ATPase [Candidatus Nezhaarchaeota archaeon]|nr:AAA family ATPase [Candidatus Nezhaarchaeota archaeon]MCX8142198.1 AAA family ATPase [Candidatus Nezhaarchaeota archaeon]MDW8050019.1 ATPase domain-containing protein [Nitrososphaerota archaeon]